MSLKFELKAIVFQPLLGSRFLCLDSKPDSPFLVLIPVGLRWFSLSPKETECLPFKWSHP